MSENSKKYEEITANLVKYNGQLRGYVYSLVRNEHDVEDIMQEIALAVWKMKDRFQPGGNFRAWVKKIAYHRVREFFRKKKRHAVPLGEDLLEQITHESFEEDVSDFMVLKRQALRDCLEKIPERSRHALMRFYNEEFDYQTIAKGLHRSMNAVHVLFHRMRKDLRVCIEQRIRAPGTTDAT